MWVYGRLYGGGDGEADEGICGGVRVGRVGGGSGGGWWVRIGLWVQMYVWARVGIGRVRCVVVDGTGIQVMHSGDACG